MLLFFHFHAILKKLNAELGWEVIHKEKNRIMELQRGGTRLTLESDGRIEFSGQTHVNLHDFVRDFKFHQNEVAEISKIFGIIKPFMPLPVSITTLNGLILFKSTKDKICCKCSAKISLVSILPGTF